ncbi:heavy metal translocating P-type ATPase [Cohnella sp. GCM10027633]|uniref:heavy metal translocating P-type ATPase n=1 Tax=unclassified Cohnella TaxID=2636738 RepID=UPI003630E304
MTRKTADLTQDQKTPLVRHDHAANGCCAAEPHSQANGTSDAHRGHDHAHEGHSDHEHDHNHAHHDHDHSHGSGRLLITLLIVSALGYVSALGLDGRADQAIVLPLYVIAIVLSGYGTFLRGLRNLTRLRFNIDTLMTIALIGAVSIGEWKEASLVAILFGLNELLEGLGMAKARNAMGKLLELAPEQALKLVDGQETVVPISELQVGDTVVVKPGDRIPSDGTVLSGFSSVNEAAITGESLPVDKTEGDAVLGGSLNNEGVLRVRISKAYAQSAIATIMKLVQEAQSQRTPTELFINRFAKVYTPIIMIIAAVVFLLPPLALGSEWLDSLYEALAVLIVGCPCALILSSPIAILSGITRNARLGVLVKGGAYLEQLGKLDSLAFDKTGTLTKGEPQVVRAIAYDEPLFYEVAVAIERGSAHPIAKAVRKHVEGMGIQAKDAEDVQASAGRGMEAAYEGRKYWLGNERSIAHLSLSDDVAAAIDALKQDALTIVAVADESRVLGLFGIADELREESRDVVAELHRSGIRTVMLTGDHPLVADKVAHAVGVKEAYGGLLPEDKVIYVKRLASEGTVGMIGDGINDTPALASAQLGIGMGKGADSAIETADVVLMQDHLGMLPAAIRIARRVNRIVRFNIAVALGLKLLALLLTIPGWLTLWVAILSDMGATIFVTFVSLTILLPGRSSQVKQR